MAKSKSPFKIENVLAAFERMRSANGFDVTTPMQWSFTFVGRSQPSLQVIRNELENRGYVFVDQYKDDEGDHWLELSKFEIHTPESLHSRNQELFAFAANFKKAEYDGWEVTRSDTEA